jgi:DHA1 family bicyclomycin/chloramphenicol resistance-like MFS transporter
MADSMTLERPSAVAATASAAHRRLSDPGLGFPAFVALIAAMMACQALGVDSMLAALPAIGRSLAVAHDNDRQWIISIYMFGFGVAQLVYGPLADRYGRRPILIVSLTSFAAMSVLAGFASSFPLLLAARLLQGIAGAASRVLTVSVMRDCYQGRQMARVMSLSFIIFLAVPMLAPSIGQIIMAFASWRAIFFFLGLFAAGVALAGGLRLKETLDPANVRPISVGEVGRAVGEVLGNRTALGYMLASAFPFGALIGYVNSVGQIFTDEFHAASRFPLIFALVAGAMGVAALVNSRLVERVGTRRVSHTATFGLIALSAVHVAVAASGRETMLSFSILQCLTMFCFGLMGSNFNAMAMEPVGHIAGTASSVLGFTSTCGGTLVGIVIGQCYNGTTVPLAAGFLLMGLVTLGGLWVTERGRLFRPHQGA